jgi:hypothetical protein
MYGVEVTFNGMTSLLKFIKNLPIGSKVIRGDTQTDRQTGDLKSLTFLFSKSGLKTEFLHKSNQIHTITKIFLPRPSLGQNNTPYRLL